MSKLRSKTGGSSVDLLSTILRSVPYPSVETGKWHWVVDNKMRAYGEVDPNRFLVRINVEKHKRDKQSLIDTLVHEELHILFPRFGETMICAMTDCRLRIMTKAQKARLYGRIRIR